LAEKLIVEDKSTKRLYHKTCFKCSVCDLALDLRTAGFANGVAYCKNHLKEGQSASASEKWKPTAVITPSKKKKEQTTESHLSHHNFLQFF
jgi:hypothetical protein